MDVWQKTSAVATPEWEQPKEEEEEDLNNINATLIRFKTLQVYREVPELWL